MFLHRAHVATLARQLAVAFVSLLLVVSSVAYLIAPVQQALGAAVAMVAAKPHHEAIDGSIRGGKRVSGIVVRAIERKHGHNVVVGTARVGRDGRFHLAVDPGTYTVVIEGPGVHIALKVRVSQGHTAFITTNISPQPQGLGVVLLIFTY